MIREGYYEELFHVDNRHWITNGFAKMKDTFWPDTDIQKARILGDFRPINTWLQPPPAHWTWACPDQATMMSSFPRGSEFFLLCDIADAYHTCRLAEASQNLVVISINGRYFKYKGGAQGLAPMALFWNCHIQDAFYAAFGLHWRHWWATFVDDIGVHGFTAAVTTARARILSTLLTHLGKPHTFGSAKTDTWRMPPATSMILAGLHISKDGFCVDDAQLVVLKHVLTDFVVRTKEDAQHVVGVIQYCYSAFRWTSNSSLLEYSQLISTLTSSWKQVAGQKTHIQWTDSCRAACLRLNELIYSQPRAYWNPDSLVTGKSCLAIMTDASDTGLGLSLHLVQKPNALDVTTDDLKDHTVSQLIATKSITLTSAQLKWHTCETELLGIVEAVIRWGSFISIALSLFPPDPLGKSAKLLFLSDSTTGISQWLSLRIPEDWIDHLSAKARRFYSWADKVAGTQYWPMSVRHIPGTDICLPHVLSHLGDQLRDRHRTLQQSGASMLALPTAIHSFHSDPRVRKPTASDIPDKSSLHHLLLQPADYPILQAAYLVDSSTFNGVSISDLYRAVTNVDSKSVPSTVTTKISPWIGTIFFSAIPPGSNVPMLYTPASHQRLSPGNHEIPEIDRTKHLVMVCPMSAAVQITDLQTITVDSAISERSTTPLSSDILQTTPIGTDYMEHDLLKDVVLFCHNVNNHPSVTHTILLVQDLIWFPKLVEYVTYHVYNCSFCIPKRQAFVGVGTSILAAARLSVLYLDHKVLDKDIKQASAPYNAVLSMMCGATRFIICICVRSMDAQTTARAIMNEWVPLFGVPRSIRSDGAFNSEVISAVSQLIGIKELDFSSPNDPKHHSLLEQKHKTLDTILNDAYSKGDINGPSDLKFYVKQAQAKLNLLVYTYGYCPFTRLTGEQPRTPIDVAIMNQPPLNLPNVDAMDKKFVDNLQHFLRDLHLWTHCANDERCKRNQAQHIIAQSKKQSIMYDLQISDIVSYQGRAVTIVDLLDATASGFMNAIIRRVDHDGAIEKQVRYSDLLPLGTMFPEKMLPQSVSIHENQFYFFANPLPTISATQSVKAGKLITYDGITQMCLMHYYENTPKTESQYTPLWISSAGVIKRARISPKKSSPYTICIHQSALCLQAPLNSAGFITKQTIHTLRSQGIVFPSSKES